ncbi:MAG: D-glycero-beta-D-manno-heptose 1,7-bisphosphate 7-phosphatase [Acidobacteria bacterium]|nr:D-glycero-beta-D-manno-heptose 1,7-bisphosphate 7-phosphatase [Acidobacteriota bacterium]
MQKAVFLDRDGVVNEDREYVSRIEDFRFIDGVFEACRELQSMGYTLVIVTNQSGIARGLYSAERYHRLTEWMLAMLAEEGIDIAGVYYCPHHPDGVVAAYRQDCRCRKPRPGMLLQAATELGLDLAHSVLVGDKEADVEAARNAGLALAILVRSGWPVNPATSRADVIVDSLRDVPALLRTAEIHRPGE